MYRSDLREHASRLRAMALTARDKGQIEYADRLTEQASGVLDTVNSIESYGQRHTKTN